MSTETTNKKIKIDNGTTFGRTYTDKAVDELLKNVGGGGITKRELVLNAPTDFTDITQTDQRTTLQFTETGNAKVDAFVEGITKSNVISLYCSIFSESELIPGVTEIARMYGTFDIPATGSTEGMPGLCFNYERDLHFLLAKAEGSYIFGMAGGSGTVLSSHIGSLSLTIFYLQ